MLNFDPSSRQWASGVVVGVDVLTNPSDLASEIPYVVELDERQQTLALLSRLVQHSAHVTLRPMCFQLQELHPGWRPRAPDELARASWRCGTEPSRAPCWRRPWRRTPRRVDVMTGR